MFMFIVIICTILWLIAGVISYTLMYLHHRARFHGLKWDGGDRAFTLLLSLFAPVSLIIASAEAYNWRYEILQYLSNKITHYNEYTEIGIAELNPKERAIVKTLQFINPEV